MKRFFWLQLVAISLVFTLLSSTVAVLIFQHVAAGALLESRKNAYEFLANILESAPYQQSLEFYEQLRSESQTVDRSIWVVSDTGQVLASNTSEAPPPDWLTLPRPQKRHEISVKSAEFHHFADLVLLRLGAPEPSTKAGSNEPEDPVYLLVRPEKDTPNRAIANAEIVVFVLSLFGTSLAGLTVLFIYLRHTSREARKVIQQLHAGDLGARFEIQKFDEIGNLKLDFNAMADEIETLVEKIKKSEKTRRDLLQELSHDLRTPLTSLKTSVETLREFRRKMSDAQQMELLTVAQSELNYFVRMLDDLFFIADLPEPGYNETREIINLYDLCEDAVHARAIAQPKVHWSLQDKTGQDAYMEGDAHLIVRLLRNCLDNAVKHASYQVTLTLTADAQQLYLDIEDDGPGMDAETAKMFGKRRKQRIQQGIADTNLSLGLGSVIIQTVTEAHGGKLNISNRRATTASESGAILRFSFPRKTRSNL
jgi:signal transduction histidine kinase